LQLVHALFTYFGFVSSGFGGEAGVWMVIEDSEPVSSITIETGEGGTATTAEHCSKLLFVVAVVVLVVVVICANVLGLGVKRSAGAAEVISKCFSVAHGAEVCSGVVVDSDVVPLFDLRFFVARGLFEAADRFFPLAVGIGESTMLGTLTAAILLFPAVSFD
jgi:uncharacterized membrane protein YtjA (UPF0391 family)